MKFVTLIAATLIFSASASAQTTRAAAKKSTAAHTQLKTRRGKAKSSRTKSTAAATGEVITLTDEKAHKAAWTFEEMLKRRLEIDTAEGVTVQQNE
jgi:hypothetical protein